MKWKIFAAPKETSLLTLLACIKSSNLPAPPSITKGTWIYLEANFKRFKSYPFPVPSLSIDCKRISPAPNSWTFCIQLATSKSDLFFPKFLNNSHLFLFLDFRSKHTTMHCDPNSLAACFINRVFSIAAVFNTTLSAPAFYLSLISSRDLIYPPIVKGTLQIFETSWIISIIFFLLFVATSDLEEVDPITFLIFSNS